MAKGLISCSLSLQNSYIANANIILFKNYFNIITAALPGDHLKFRCKKPSFYTIASRVTIGV